LSGYPNKSLLKKMSEDLFYEELKYIINHYDNINVAVKKICNLKYPHTNKYISEEHAIIYYNTYRRFSTKIELDKDFDKNAYAKNKKYS
jgi:hypothetical protein